ncbi:hypothetical protein HQN90_12425 [Paenibacillus alba]|nr:hypothetical protein [Paenibacillus alba]NQX66926.1 hypothetical protein [Paenibacillus alba]
MTALIQNEHVSKFYHMGGETIRTLDDISLDIVHGNLSLLWDHQAPENPR